MTGWPAMLWFVRHGESQGNVARAHAYANGAEEMTLASCDSEADLTPLGRAQAALVGQRLHALPVGERPTHAVVSTYLRAQETLNELLAAGLDIPVRVDERLRDREQGILHLLTTAGILARYPREAERRVSVGKFAYRPPGGESWADVALRLRAALLDLRLDNPGDRVLLVTHDVVVILSRLVLTGLPVHDAIRLSGEVANCSVTTYQAAGPGMTMTAWNDTSHLVHPVPATTSRP